MQRRLTQPIVQVLIANNCAAERFTVVYKRPTDLQLGKDVPICCNVVICDMLDEGAHMLIGKNGSLVHMFMPWFEHGTCCV